MQTVGHTPQALVFADVFHLVKLVGEALDEVRRDLWQQLRHLPDDRYAKAFKGSRWALLKNPEDLTDRQAAQLAKLKWARGGIWRAYEMKEQFRAIFTAGLEPGEAIKQRRPPPPHRPRTRCPDLRTHPHPTPTPGP